MGHRRYLMLIVLSVNNNNGVHVRFTVVDLTRNGENGGNELTKFLVLLPCPSQLTRTLSYAVLLELLNLGYACVVIDNYDNSSTEALRRIRQLAPENAELIECPGDLADLKSTVETIKVSLLSVGVEVF